MVGKYSLRFCLRLPPSLVEILPFNLKVSCIHLGSRIFKFKEEQFTILLLFVCASNKALSLPIFIVSKLKLNNHKNSIEQCQSQREKTSGLMSSCFHKKFQTYPCFLQKDTWKFKNKGKSLDFSDRKSCLSPKTTIFFLIYLYRGRTIQSCLAFFVCIRGWAKVLFLFNICYMHSVWNSVNALSLEKRVVLLRLWSKHLLVEYSFHWFTTGKAKNQQVIEDKEYS